MNALYIVELDEDEKAELKKLLQGGSEKVRKLKRAQVLLTADQGKTDKEIAEAIDVGTATVFRTRRKYVEGGLQHALSEKQRPGGERKLSKKDVALVSALACSDAPSGRAKWTLELLAGEVVRLTEHEGLSKETVRRRLKENKLKPWRHSMWCIPKVDAEYVARMEDILDLYDEPPDPTRPLVNFDETPIQLIGETRVPIAAKKGRLRKIDYEYKRNGTANLFVMVDRHAGWRKVNVTEQRTKIDFARPSDEGTRRRRLSECERGPGGSSTTSTRTCRHPSTKPSPPLKRGVSCASWSSISHQSTQAGSTWLRSRLEYCLSSAWIAGSPTRRL